MSTTLKMSSGIAQNVSYLEKYNGLNMVSFMPEMGNLEHMDFSNLPVPTKHTPAENGWHIFLPLKEGNNPKPKQI